MHIYACRSCKVVCIHVKTVKTPKQIKYKKMVALLVEMHKVVENYIKNDPIVRVPLKLVGKC